MNEYFHNYTPSWEVHLNGIKQPKENYKIFKMKGCILLFIYRDLLNEGDNVELRSYPCSGNKTSYYKQIDIKDGVTKSIFVTLENYEIGNVEDLKNDIIVLWKQQNDQHFKRLGTYLVQHLEKKRIRITVTGDFDIGDTILIFNQNICITSDIFHTNIGEDHIPLLTTGFYNPQYLNEDGILMNVITADKLMLYFNGNPMFRGYDYTVRPTPNYLFVDLYLTTGLNKEVEFVANKFLNNSLVHYQDTISPSGVIDLTDSIFFPFSLKYMTVYVNDVKMGSDNIEIISDRIFRLKDISSLRNLEIFMNKDIWQLNQYLLDSVSNTSSLWSDFIENKLDNSGEVQLLLYLSRLFEEEAPEFLEDTDFYRRLIDRHMNYIALLIRDGILRYINSNEQYTDIFLMQRFEGKEIILDSEKILSQRFIIDSNADYE